MNEGTAAPCSGRYALFLNLGQLPTLTVPPTRAMDGWLCKLRSSSCASSSPWPWANATMASACAGLAVGTSARREQYHDSRGSLALREHTSRRTMTPSEHSVVPAHRRGAHPSHGICSGVPAGLAQAMTGGGESGCDQPIPTRKMASGRAALRAACWWIPASLLTPSIMRSGPPRSP